MTDGVMVHKMGWCFTCDADDCQHFKNTTQELINALQDGEAFTKNGKIIPADDVYLNKPDPLEEVFSVSAVSGRINAALEARGLEIREKD